MERWVTPWLLLAPFLCYSCQWGTQSKKGSLTESWRSQWKCKDEVSVLIFAGSVGQPGAEHHTSAPGLHLAICFESYFLVTLLKSFCKSAFTFWGFLILLGWVALNFHEERGVALRMFYWNGGKTRYSARANQEAFAQVYNIVWEVSIAFTV